jgi:outer membrane assembly lipoprotein YfiO
MNRLSLPGYHPRMSFSVRGRPVRFVFAAALAVIGACSQATFTPQEASTNQSLYVASLKAEQKHNWGKASKGFEQLTFQLPARDPLLPLAYFHLGIAHQHLEEYILAAQAFSRVPENFPEDTLAALATFQAGLSYEKLWKRPDLDPDYGTTAISTFQSFIAAYPDSPLRDSAQKQINHLREMFAEKNLMTAGIYAVQRAWDSAIIYYRYVITTYPDTPSYKDAMLGLVKAYNAISYREDAADACTTLRQKFPSDRDVVHACGKAPGADSLAAKPAAPAKP